jgi:hypothetical protein
MTIPCKRITRTTAFLGWMISCALPFSGCAVEGNEDDLLEERQATDVEQEEDIDIGVVQQSLSTIEYYPPNPPTNARFGYNNYNTMTLVASGNRALGLIGNPSNFFNLLDPRTNFQLCVHCSSGSGSCKATGEVLMNPGAVYYIDVTCRAGNVTYAWLNER